MPLVVWRFNDGKAGHDNQTRGLAEALARLRLVETHTLDPLPPAAALKGWLLGRLPSWRNLPAPDLLMGAGHRTHFSLLAARRSRGGRVVVLMRPSLPLGLFDLCLIPEHDAPPTRSNVLATRGALNRVQPSATLESDRGLLLIGGPSAHFGWDDAALRQAIMAIVAADPSMQWTLTQLSGRCIRSDRRTADGSSCYGHRAGLAAGATGAGRAGVGHRRQRVHGL
jgi:uncharacterized protein